MAALKGESMELYQIWLICSAPIVFAGFTLYAVWADNREQRSKELDKDKAFSLFIEGWLDEIEKRGK